MRGLGIFGLIVAIGLLITAMQSFFIVDQTEEALVLQVGAAKEAYNEPGTNEAGLKMKLPFVQSVIKYDRRNIGLDIPNIEVLASNQEQLIVDAFVRYQISDPLAFYQRLVTQRTAEAQLSQFTNTAIRNALANKLPEEIISGQRATLMDTIRQNLSESTAGRGITIIDVRIRRADLPQDVSERVFRRMEAARNQEAELIRANGDKQAQAIRAKADRDRTVILAEANQKSEEIRGEGDAKRNEIYAAAYGRDPEFFRFQRALIACEQSLSKKTQIVVGPDRLNLCDEFIDAAKTSGR
ncbi:MAG TPA: protease modulator HflC [Hyphomonas sp.]|nr:protease modulator HflC [Hyphomonas sp.]MCB9961063.1 protease modulator HflC [Hyphomonas sp.]MCB9970354.1 protease modulator HflC [Hyphomonas sp.]HPE48513.1 protease modulator HflC [Hyphomonas sp.]